jgi:superfamily II DNA or RNA helicase
MIKATIGDVIASVSTSDLVDEGILVPTDIIMVEYSHAGHRYPKDNYGEYYYKAVVENDERNKILIQTAYHLYKAGKPVLMAVQRVDHGKVLELAMQHLVGPDHAKFVYGEDHSTYRDETLGAFKAGKLPILISTLISEGVDMPMLAHCVAGRGEASRIATIQLMGRGMRAFPGKTKAVYVDIMDTKSAWLSKHTKTRAIAYNNERAFTTIPVDVKDLGTFLKGYQL